MANPTVMPCPCTRRSSDISGARLDVPWPTSSAERVSQIRTTWKLSSLTRPERGARQTRALGERAQLRPHHRRIDALRAGGRPEAAVNACDHTLASDRFREPGDALRDELG